MRGVGEVRKSIHRSWLAKKLGLGLLCWGFKGVQEEIPFYTYTLNIRGTFNKVPDFFVPVFKIVVDSWRFSMLLLYILWDDWRFFLILGSNEQLQQQLEYTLLKSYCHSWLISKMQSGLEDTLEQRYAIKLCFKFGKNARETYGMQGVCEGLWEVWEE